MKVFTITPINRDFADAHFIIKGFGNGEASDIVLHNQDKKFKYPLMFIEDLTFPIEQNEFTFAFRVFFVAQVASLKQRGSDLMSTNENEVKSDMVACAQDLLSFWAKDLTISDLNLIKSSLITTFTDNTEDRLTGCFLEIRLKQGFRYNKCAIPMAGVTPPPPPAINPIDVSLNSILMRAGQTANVDITIFKTGTTDPVGSGTEGNPFFISTQGTDNLEKGTVVSGVLRIADSPLSANGDFVKNIISEDGFNLPILDAADQTPVNSSVVGETIEVLFPATTSLPYRPISAQRTSFATSGGDDGDDATNGLFDDDFKTDFFNLKNANPTWPQHNKRFTGVNGGFKNEDTGLWFDVDGNASDIATVLADDWYYDHLTKTQWYRFDLLSLKI